MAKEAANVVRRKTEACVMCNRLASDRINEECKASRKELKWVLRRARSGDELSLANRMKENHKVDPTEMSEGDMLDLKAGVVKVSEEVGLQQTSVHRLYPVMETERPRNGRGVRDGPGESTGRVEIADDLHEVYEFCTGAGGGPDAAVDVGEKDTDWKGGVSASMKQPVIIQIENIYYPILAIIGVPANLFAIVILSRGKCGLSKCITLYLVSMAVSDLMVLIFEVILYEIKDGYFPYSFLNLTPVCSVNLTLLFMSIDCSVWLTVTFTFDRFVAICCQKLRGKYCTEKTAALVIAVVCSLSVIENIPMYFVYAPREIIDNVAWSCGVTPDFYTSPLLVAFWWFETILTPFTPFLLIMLLNALTIRHIIHANRVRSGLRANKKDESGADQEVENRRKSIILLLAVSGSFILLWMVIFVCFISVHFIDVQFLATAYDDPFTIAEQSGYMLRCLSACTNTFIYAVSQTKFREELKNLTSGSPGAPGLSRFRQISRQRCSPAAGHRLTSRIPLGGGCAVFVATRRPGGCGPVESEKT
ncbi:neuromedin-U receptor 2-like [Rhinoraja longicauda]